MAEAVPARLKDARWLCGRTLCSGELLRPLRPDGSGGLDPTGWQLVEEVWEKAKLKRRQRHGRSSWVFMVVEGPLVVARCPRCYNLSIIRV